MTNTPSKDHTSEIQALKKQVDLLTKAANKQKLARHTPKEDFGQTVKINLYRADYKEDYRVVTGWKLLKDEVDYRGSHKHEDQVVELTLLNTSTNQYENTSMTYLDFVRDIDKEAVSVISNRFNRKTGEDLVTVEWNGTEYELGLPFIN